MVVQWFRTLLAPLFAFMRQNKSEEVDWKQIKYLIESFTFGNLEVLSEDDDKPKPRVVSKHSTGTRKS